MQLLVKFEVHVCMYACVCVCAGACAAAAQLRSFCCAVARGSTAKAQLFCAGQLGMGEGGPTDCCLPGISI